MKRAAIVAALTWLAATATAPRAQAGPSEARKEAVARRLAEDPGWLRLLHARPTAANGVEAEPDGPEFYLSPRGRFDPAAELASTIDALYAAPGRADAHALCAFPARARFLRERLDLPGLPSPVCASRDAFFERLRPRRVHLVFSAYHVASPASAFGHVLIRIERDDAGRVRPDAPPHALADLGVDYSADTGAEGPFAYAVKGLFGLFSGSFKALPYAAKVREYQDHESRDLWEYELDLDRGEVRALLEHLWELGATRFDYLYLSENCAYHVLGLLDVVRPSARLVERLKSPVLPGDAVRAVWESGLVARVRYRPSLRAVTEARLEALAPPWRALALALADGAREDDVARLARLPVEGQRDVLDAALDRLDFAHPELLVDEAPTAARVLRGRLLALRAAVPGESPELVVKRPPGDAPHLAHGSRRVAIGAGYATDGGAFAEVGARLALHDTLDASWGMPRLATLEALSMSLRAYPRGRLVELERLTVIRVERLAPRGAVERGLTYRLFVGGDRVRDAGCDARGSCLAARLDGGAGLAAELSRGALVYARGDASLEAADGLVGLARGGVRVGLGPSAGARLELARGLTMLGEARVAWLPGAPHALTAQASAEARVALGRHVAMGLGLRRQPSAADAWLSALFYY